MTKISALDNSNILITGGTGSWGHELVTQLIQKYPQIKQIRIYSRGEHKQVDMKREFNSNPKLKFIIGDIRDKNILNFAMHKVDFVFHLAALKHVPVCEENSWEAVLTNIVGTQNVIETALHNKVKKVIDVSTDKAVDPFNMYGVTKACGEKLMINANYNYASRVSQTAFICIRGGNVIGTNGSVIPLFKSQIETKNEITITNPHMTRFLMSTKEAIGLIFTAVEDSIGGELYVMKMPATNIRTIAESMILLFGNKKTKIKIIGERPGEKIDEILISKNESKSSYSISNDYNVILPQTVDKQLINKYSKFDKLHLDEFSSKNTVQVTQQMLVNILKREKWLWSKN